MHTVSNIPQSEPTSNQQAISQHFIELAYAIFDPFLTLCAIFSRLPFALPDLMLIWKYPNLSLCMQVQARNLSINRASCFKISFSRHSMINLRNFKTPSGQCSAK